MSTRDPQSKGKLLMNHYILYVIIIPIIHVFVMYYIAFISTWNVLCLTSTTACPFPHIFSVLFLITHLRWTICMAWSLCPLCPGAGLSLSFIPPTPSLLTLSPPPPQALCGSSRRTTLYWKWAFTMMGPTRSAMKTAWIRHSYLWLQTATWVGFCYWEEMVNS